MITEHNGPYGRNEGQDPTRLPGVSGLSASSPHDYRRLDATPETSAAMIREHAPKTAAAIIAAYERRLTAEYERRLARTLDTDGGER